MLIAEIRKEKGRTQLEPAEKMGVTDKAVSKWERDLSCPDIHSLPALAEILGVSMDQLMRWTFGTPCPCRALDFPVWPFPSYGAAAEFLLRKVI